MFLWGPGRLTCCCSMFSGQVAVQVAVVVVMMATLAACVSFLPSQDCLYLGQTDILSTAASRSRLECASRCATDPACDVIKFQQRAHGRCVTSRKPFRLPPSPTSTDLGFCMEKRCLHGGRQEADGSCSCVQGYIGERCQHLALNCLDIEGVVGRGGEGIYFFQHRLWPHPFPVLCLQGGEALMMRRTAGNVNFNRSWADYVEGFGNMAAGDFWTGLRYWSYLTQSGMTIMSIFITDVNGTLLSQDHASFEVSDESQNFVMTFASSTGQLGNFLDGDCGLQFSTYDRDNDLSQAINCAELHGGGWWFKDCGHSNPTGPLNRPPDGMRREVNAEAFWGEMGKRAPWTIEIRFAFKG